MLNAGWVWERSLTFTAGAYRLELDPENVSKSLDAELDKLDEEPDINPELMGAAENAALRLGDIRTIDQWVSQEKRAQEQEQRSQEQQPKKTKNKSKGWER